MNLIGGVAAETATYQGPRAFFRRHSNGDYSLGRSYWVNTLLVSLFAPALGLLLFPALQDLPARYSSAAVLGLTALGLLAWTWAINGTWASANKHVIRGGKQGWATAAKVMIVLGVFRTVSEVTNMSGSLAEHWRVALGGQPGAQYTIQVSADGKSVVLNGGMNDGAAEALTRALDLAPAVNNIVFNSTGGWVREGNLVAKVISERRLTTYVEGECTSACTIAFLAGIERAAGPDAHIGFHQFKPVGESSGSASDDAMARTVYDLAGVPREFIARVLSTPPDNVWYPKHEELLAANIITRRSFGGEIASAATRLLTRDAVVAPATPRIDLSRAKYLGPVPPNWKPGDLIPANVRPREEPLPEQTRLWLTRNSWYGMPGYEAQTEKAMRIDQELAAEGYDPQSRTYFDELDRRLSCALLSGRYRCL